MIDVTYLDGTTREFDADDFQRSIGEGDGEYAYLVRGGARVAIVNLSAVLHVSIRKSAFCCPKCHGEYPVKVNGGPGKLMRYDCGCGWSGAYGDAMSPNLAARAKASPILNQLAEKFVVQSGNNLVFADFRDPGYQSFALPLPDGVRRDDSALKWIRESVVRMLQSSREMYANELLGVIDSESAKHPVVALLRTMLKNAALRED